MRLVIIALLLGACSTPQSRCSKFFRDLRQKTEDCGIDVGPFVAADDQCATPSAETLLDRSVRDRDP
jgi:hypothetical protein